LPFRACYWRSTLPQWCRSKRDRVAADLGTTILPSCEFYNWYQPYENSCDSDQPIVSLWHLQQSMQRQAVRPMLSGFILGQTLPESRRCDLLCASDSATSNEVGTKEYVRTSEARAPAITCAAASLSLARLLSMPYINKRGLKRSVQTPASMSTTDSPGPIRESAATGVRLSSRSPCVEQAY
jgi:hypothetical protein